VTRDWILWVPRERNFNNRFWKNNSNCVEYGRWYPSGDNNDCEFGGFAGDGDSGGELLKGGGGDWHGALTGLGGFTGGRKMDWLTVVPKVEMGLLPMFVDLVV
jgi:hypothetical protein